MIESQVFRLNVTRIVTARKATLICRKLQTVVIPKCLTNRPDFFICTLRNDAIKCSKLQWNHAPQASGFTAKFYGVISMVYKSADHEKVWSIRFFFTITRKHCSGISFISLRNCQNWRRARVALQIALFHGLNSHRP